ncbi:DNA gyrase inhibitor YacG [Sphingomonas bacterium]|uniref:DNA gyrase inhibitor YacG n=1 Tax=Sphingomonas bacterium TaxID=1895847 RepID=UPI00157500CB|nr:DNA gyrase inhibitor YacG [Sphingomonas bacterium]
MIPQATCPLCAKPTAADHAPFCSRGCRDRDLLAWLSEDYRLPGRDPAPDRLDSAGDGD